MEIKNVISRREDSNDQACLQSLPLYSMVAFAPPKTVNNRMEVTCSNFLWGNLNMGINITGLVGNGALFQFKKLALV